MIRRSRVGLTFLIALLAVAGTAGGQEVYLRRFALVEGARLTLGALADVAAADPAVRRGLEAVDLGPAPERPMLLPLRILKGRLDGAPDWRGTLIGSRLLLLPEGAAPADASGVTGGVPPGGRAFLRDLLGWLDGREADPAARVEVDLPHPGELAAAAAVGSAAVAAEGAPAGAGAFVFQADEAEGGLRVRWRLGATPGAPSGTLAVRLRRFLPVAVAVEELPPGAELAPGKVRLEEAEAAADGAGPGDPLREVPQAGRYRVLARIPAGGAVPLHSLQKSLPVKGGDLVRLRFVREGIRVFLQGRAYASGDLGKPVDVAAVLSGKRFRGTVVGFQEVEVVLP